LEWDEDLKFEKQYQHKSNSQWFGRAKDPGRPRILDQNIRDGGFGVFDWYDVDDACANFVVDQMTRFGLPMNSRLRNIVYSAGVHAFYYASVVDPYCLFTRGLTDVELSDEWMSKTFEIKTETKTGRHLHFNPEPEEVECYKSNTPQGEAFFHHIMQQPFLDYENAMREFSYRRGQRAHQLHDIAMSITEFLDEELCSMGVEELMGNQETYAELKELCSYDGPEGERIVDYRRMEFYFEFAAWAAFIWILSPLSRNWRCDSSSLFAAVLDDGEALLVGYEVFPRGTYRKTDRPFSSCFVCGIQAWCFSDQAREVEVITLSGPVLESHLVKVCEHCVTEGFPILPPDNCGLRICRMAQCKHHPSFNFDPNRRLHETMKSTGQLLLKSDTGTFLPGMQAQSRLAGRAAVRDILF
jgi:hypothetical protein